MKASSRARLALSLPFALAVAAVVGCTEDPSPSGAAPVDASATDGAPADSAAPVDAGATDSAPPTDAGVLLRKVDLTLSGFPHLIDVVSPPSPKRAVVFLHGGGGSKEGGAQALGLRASATDPASWDTAWLLAHDVAFVFPQGQAKAGTRGFTWDNYVMTSGADDLAFLGALATAIRGGTLDSALPKLTSIAVSGHSNGGMMTNRLWCEAPQLFDAYVAFAGPASVHLGASGDHPCAPAVAKPYLGLVGGKDTVLQTDGNWLKDVWTIAPALAATLGFVDPNLVNELTFHKSVRVPKRCGGATSGPQASAGTTTWSDCNGSVQLVRVTDADHCLSGTSCGTSLEGGSGARVVDTLVNFFRAQAP